MSLVQIQSPLPFFSYKGTVTVARLQTIIPVIAISIIIACRLQAADVDTAADASPNEASTTSEAPESEAGKCKASFRPEMTEQEQRQMQEMQSVLYQMHEDTWDDRYRH